jgi:hypothetical protein
MTWTEGVLHISENFEIHGGYLGIISFSVFVIVIITYILFVCSVGALIGDTIKKINKNLNNKN